MPTANDALFQNGREEDFFQATVTGDWRSGQYGCVRENGRQFHEGIDIRCLERDRKGEPLDAVRAVSAGTVVYINDRPGRSNYGRYIIVQHNFSGTELLSLYAHLSAIADDLKTGNAISRGQRLGTLGHSAATRSGIPRERAHLHFELNFFINPNFEAWYRKHYPKEPNDHGVYNGQNLIGLDPAALFRAARENPKLTVPEFIRQRPEAFRVLVGPRLRWLERNGWSLTHAPTLQRSDALPAAYEISFDCVGIPRQITPRTATDLTDAQKQSLSKDRPVLLQANDSELSRCDCRHLVRKTTRGLPAARGEEHSRRAVAGWPRGARGWQLSDKGLEWIELLTY